MIVTVLGRSGLTNAYRSVLSAAGSLAISGASRWLEARLADGSSARAMAISPHSATIERIRVRTIGIVLLYENSTSYSWTRICLSFQWLSFAKARLDYGHGATSQWECSGQPAGEQALRWSSSPDMVDSGCAAQG